MERIIRVTGKGKLSVKPDTTRLIMTIEGMHEDYGEAVELSSKMTDIIKEIFVDLNFEKKDVKTLSFRIDEEYESYKDKDNNWKRRFEGFKFTHRFKVDFPVDNDRLGRILYVLVHAPIRPEFRIEYTVADPEAQKNELLKKAVADAKEKAGVLSEASGVVLGDILTIDYSWGEIDFVTRPMEHMVLEERCMAAPPVGAESYDMDIEPDDIEVTDTVTVVWGIS